MSDNRKLIKAKPEGLALMKAIAKDIGSAVFHHIETMYPDAVKASSSTFRTSVQNCTFNEIMAAVKITDAGQIISRLDDRKKHRRKVSAMYKQIRKERTS